MASEQEEIGKRKLGTYVLCRRSYPAWPELGFGAGMAPPDDWENARIRLKVGEAGVRS